MTENIALYDYNFIEHIYGVYRHVFRRLSDAAFGQKSSCTKFLPQNPRRKIPAAKTLTQRP